MSANLTILPFTRKGQLVPNGLPVHFDPSALNKTQVASAVDFIARSHGKDAFVKRSNEDRIILDLDNDNIVALVQKRNGDAAQVAVAEMSKKNPINSFKEVLNIIGKLRD